VIPLSTQTLEFAAEARQLLQLMVHSIYSNKDIFLRELISNASDALDKLRLEALVARDLNATTDDLHIQIEVDREARTLTVRDNGVGMSREEVISLIGTIAKSGTAEFLRMMKDKDGSAELIGQFGVGFYSTFMVADRVTLVTRHAADENGTRWESTGEGTYTVEDVEKPPQGTSVTLHLKAVDAEDGLHDYTEAWTLKGIVKRYSDFIAWPIKLDGETLNSMKALWARPKDEVEQEEYNELYKHVAHDWTDPLRTIHMKAEGTFEYESLLFIPRHAPFDLFMREGRQGVQLYVKRVFIMDHCEELMPEYLRFVRGVVDAADLSLNVSREILQKDRQIQLMRRRLVKKVVGTLEEMRDEAADDFKAFWDEFGRAMKEGLYSDTENRDALLDLALFPTTHGDEPTSLKAYVERMKPDQQDIYYIAGESRSSLHDSPHLEAFKAKGLEVLLLTDPIDEIWPNAVGVYQEKRLQSAARGAVDLGADEEKQEEREEQSKSFATLLSWLQTRLESNIKEARISSRLTTSPACLVSDANDPTPNLEKLMRAMGQEVPKFKRILELNPQHALVTKLRDAYEQRKDDPSLAEVAELLYGVAVLAEGGELEDPARFGRLLAEHLAAAV